MTGPLKRQLSTEQRSIIFSFLNAQSTLSLATVDEFGKPQVAPVFYISDDALNLYWLSSADSRHSVNLTSRQVVAATIYPNIWQWKDIRGLQIEGTAEAVQDDRVREQVLTLYLRKFTLPPDLDSQIAASTLYILTPAWIRWSDNGVRFGFRIEATL